MIRLATIVCLAGCVSGEFQEGSFECDPSGGAEECPPGQLCAPNGLCQASDACDALTCADITPGCGVFGNECGGSIECGCVMGSSCNGGACTCPPGDLYQEADAERVDSVGTDNNPWLEAGGARMDGGNWANVELGPDQDSTRLQLSRFAFDVPAEVEIRGITVVIKRQKNLAGRIRDLSVQLLRGGVPYGQDRAHETLNWPDVWEPADYGGANIIWGWGDEMTRDAVIDSGFGVAVRAKNPSTDRATALVDHVRMGVFYSCTALSREVE